MSRSGVHSMAGVHDVDDSCNSSVPYRHKESDEESDDEQLAAGAAVYGILPPPVQTGDRVSIVAPSGAVNKNILQFGCEILKQWGLQPVVDDRVGEEWAYLAGPDEHRAQALVDAFNDPTTKAVICAGGGYGSTRILLLLSQSGLHENALQKKRFFGFSDITALHSFCRLLLPGYISFHSPMIASSYFRKGTDESRRALKLALFQRRLSSACPTLQGCCYTRLQTGNAAESGGKVQGVLVGGNLSLIAALVGTPWQEELSGKILFLEDVDEASYRVDRMVMQLVTSTGGRLFQDLAGLVLGHFGPPREGGRGPPVDSMFWFEMIGLPPSLPVLHEIPVGHILDNRVLPLGAVVEMDLDKAQLKVVEQVELS
ncbi:hypothetical protein CBR_g30025 [Chara braunii]|uniref:LD-carboxypeptidase N-terminal domain-containing protein n=1 Tax=Chara braunii TaxID=69332 RepID=A0A388LBT4_CHABU|nr:hypothetical protein CBR_g30025 [Chara braunii]|eukprot:GBG79761.1 hypothetical protein CBR_g30025 [Chara braunii]